MKWDRILSTIRQHQTLVCIHVRLHVFIHYSYTQNGFVLFIPMYTYVIMMMHIKETASVR